ncbi:LamG-like jellyroll fold domain-containing protein [Aeoliella sp.]|uniref:LamG-like jellyroll fold domain-containing protein n=1 Tax=Aeoliella sp. TaxID=2795800 RepID=UPI003CCBFFDE
MPLFDTICSACQSLADLIAGLDRKKLLVGAAGLAVAWAGQSASADFLDDFETDTSANYSFEDSYGGGGSFDVSNGTLNIASSGNNTAMAYTTATVPFAVGESLGVDVAGLSGSAGVFLTLGQGAGQPSGGNSGYRWRRDINGLRPQAADDGILIVTADPDPASNATLWIDRVAADTFEFKFQLEGEFARTSIFTDTYAALAGLAEMHIGMQHFGGSAATRPFDNLRIVDTAIIDNPPTLTLSVDAVSGQVAIMNSSGTNFEVDYYLIESAGGAMNESGWNSLADQNLDSAAGGDYNGDGSVNIGDYTVWRNNLGASITLANENPAASTPGVVDAEDYEFWKSQFGVVGSSGWGEAGGSDEFKLAELSLAGSTLSDGSSVGLGAAFNPAVFGAGNVGDLEFLVRLTSGQVLTGDVVYSNAGAIAATVVPEPSTHLLMFCGVVGLGVVARRRFTLPARSCRATHSIAVSIVAWAAVGSTALATITLDRSYQFGDPGTSDATLAPPSVEQAANVGEGNPMGFVFGGTTSTGDDESPFVDLEVFGATYTSTAARPGASAGHYGAHFDGVNDYLRGQRLGLPSTSVNSIDGGGPLNYSGISDRGLHFWANPSSAGSGTAQSLIADTEQHGVRISSGGTWVMQYNGVTVDSGEPVSFDDWSHVMLVRPYGSAGGARLYVDGIAIAAAAGGYDGSDLSPLVVGANSGDTPGTADYFSGVIDDLELFVMGQATESPFDDWGTFDYATDNHVAASMLTGIAGDVDQDGSLTPQDVDDFIAGFFQRNLVNGIQVGDITSIKQGDLNLDGFTNLDDAFLLHTALVANGMGGLGQFGFTVVPEPHTWAITISAIGLFGLMRSRSS